MVYSLDNSEVRDMQTLVISPPYNARGAIGPLVQAVLVVAPARGLPKAGRRP